MLQTKCQLCQKNPKSHSFEHIASSPNGIRIFYTAPALSEARNSRDLKSHLDEARITKWVWVLDCSKMETKHSSSLEFIQEIADILSKEHDGILQRIVILKANMWVRWAAAMAKTFVRSDLLNRVMFTDDILGDLQKLFLPMTVIHSVLWRHHQLSLA